MICNKNKNLYLRLIIKKKKFRWQNLLQFYAKQNAMFIHVQPSKNLSQQDVNCCMEEIDDDDDIHNGIDEIDTEINNNMNREFQDEDSFNSEEPTNNSFEEAEIINKNKDLESTIIQVNF